MDKKGFALIISIMVFISTLLQYGLIFLMTITNEGLKSTKPFKPEIYEYATGEL